jgi:hypothetical protein
LADEAGVFQVKYRQTLEMVLDMRQAFRIFINLHVSQINLILGVQGLLVGVFW